MLINARETKLEMHLYIPLMLPRFIISDGLKLRSYNDVRQKTFNFTNLSLLLMQFKSSRVGMDPAISLLTKYYTENFKSFRNNRYENIILFFV